MREFGKFVVLQILRAYKWALSPMFPPACRYVPTCSEYAVEAVDRYGVLRGGWKALTRLLRCHPLSRGGYDPVVKGENPHPSTGSGQAFSQKRRDPSTSSGQTVGHPTSYTPSPTLPASNHGASFAALSREL